MEDQDYILFDQYINKELSEEEISAFEEKLKKDKVFASQFNLYKDIYSNLQHSIENEAETNAFKSNLEHISNQHFNKSETSVSTKKKTNFFKLSQLAIAASVAIFLGIFAFNQFSNPTYSDYNSHEPMTIVRNDGAKDLIEATNAFNNEDYEKANALLKTVLEKKPENSELQLYYAITNIELDNYNLADANLNSLISGTSAYKNKALWYLALSKFKQENRDACILLLKQIPESADDYKQAQKLLNKLD